MWQSVGNKIIACLFIILVMVIAIMSNYQFLPTSEFGDGFAMQLTTAGTIVLEGTAS